MNKPKSAGEIERGRTAEEQKILFDKLMAQFNQYVDAGDLPHGLTQQKIQDRATDYQVKEGKLTFCMSRHRATGGARYRKGLPMAALVETNMTYVFDPVTQSLDEEREGESSVNIEDEYECANNICQDTGINATRLNNGKFLLMILGDGVKKEVASYKEAATIVKASVRSWNLDGYMSGLGEAGARHEHEVEKTLRGACVKVMIEKLKDAWPSR